MTQDVRRKLTAILAADVVGYSRLMGGDEAGTLSALRAHREELIEPKVAQHAGRIVKLIGDGILAEFPSAVEAVSCAVEIQMLMRDRNATTPADQQIVFRIGVNIGDVIAEGDDIYGDGVNVAARLEGLADPSGICIARSVRNQVRDKLSLTYLDRGEVEVKNMARPIRVFAVPLDAKAAAHVTEVVSVPKQSSTKSAMVITSGAAIFAALALGIVWWQPWQAPHPSDVVAPVANDRPAIAVLPFANLSNEPDREYFADGLTDDLITDLSKISGLLVISRNSAFAYKNRAVEVRTVAQDLNVDFVVEGSVRRAGNAVRINAQLTDGRTGSHVWAERYDRQYADIFSIQDEVIGSIVAALEIQLTDAEQSEVARLPTDNLEAYDFFLRAEKLAYHAEFKSAAKALELYQRAIALDPEFAEPYAGYARVAVDVLTYGFFNNLPSAVARKRAYEAASRAVSLNPHIARSYSVLALLQMLEGEQSTAVTSAKRAVEVSPNSDEAHLNLAVTLIYAGRLAEAFEAIEILLRLNPKPPGYVHEYHALALYLDQRYEEGKAVLGQSDTATSSELRLELLATLNARLGHMGPAKEAASALLARWPETSIDGYRVQFAHHARTEDLNARLEGLRLAGVPQWPHGFEGDPALRLDGDEIEALTNGRTWIGERVGLGPISQYIQGNGEFIERGPDYQMTGLFSRRGDELCIRSAALLLGREHCGPIFRNLSGTREKRNEFTYVNSYRLIEFSVIE